SYSLGIAWDRTAFRNHGVVHRAPPGTGFFKGSLSFSKARGGPGSLVVIPPSPSMERMGAVRVRVLAYLHPSGHAAHRHNLVEGEHSFALFMNSNRSIQGTFLAPDGRWIGIKSAPNA